MTGTPQVVPLTTETDPERGGRWLRWTAGSREWLWSNPDPGVRRTRRAAVPGDGFADAGGAEECIPTIRGLPDHGAAWTLPWQQDDGIETVELPGTGRLTRSIRGCAPLVVDYELAGRPGTGFVHAVHALLDLSPAARLVLPGVSRVRNVEDGSWQAWPGGLDRLGPDDGTATCVLAPGCHQARVVDGDHSLSLEWSAPGAEDRCSLLFWRNLRGWPGSAPYRSIGIEPMVGRTAELTTADPDEPARIDASGRFTWSLRLTARQVRWPDTGAVSGLSR